MAGSDKIQSGKKTNLQLNIADTPTDHQAAILQFYPWLYSDPFENSFSQTCCILSVTFSVLPLTGSVCIQLSMWLLLTLSAHFDFTCHPSISNVIFSFSHLISCLRRAPVHLSLSWAATQRHTRMMALHANSWIKFETKPLKHINYSSLGVFMKLLVVCSLAVAFSFTHP